MDTQSMSGNNPHLTVQLLYANAVVFVVVIILVMIMMTGTSL